MERRLILAFGLSLVIYLVWGYFFMPPAPEPQIAESPAISEPAESETSPAEVELDSAATIDADAPELESIIGGTAVRETIDTDLSTVVFSADGGRILSWKLKDYLDPLGNPLELIPRFTETGGSWPLAIEMDDRSLTKTFNEAVYVIERTGNEVLFRWADGRGLEATKTLRFRDDEYLVDLTLDIRDRGRRLPARIVWGPSFSAQEPGKKTNFYYDGRVVVNLSGEIDRTKKRKVELNKVGGAMRWAGLEDQYFAALILPGTPVGEAVMWAEPLLPIPAGLDAPEADAKVENASYIAVQVPEEGATLFVGPKKYELLRSYGSELEKVVSFSSFSLFTVIAKFLFLSLLWIYSHTIANYGLAIILTTVTLRLVLFPLNQWSMMSIRKSQSQMQAIQPKVNALKKKYSKSKDMDSRAKMNQELMALYKREGVNPMGGVTGCLPMLAQFPILISFYNMLTVAIELRGAPFFGWIQDLSVKDPYYITPLLMGVTMFVQQKLAMNKVTDPQMKQQQKIMMFMPFFFTYICVQMPSGLVIYWFINNLLGIGQQWLVNKRVEKLPAPQKA